MGTGSSSAEALGAAGAAPEAVALSHPAAMNPPDPQVSLRDLAGAARAGDPAATERLMSNVHLLAVRYARARLGQFAGATDAAQDAAQEVCVAVLTALARYDERGLPFEAFVYSITSRKVADVQRSVMRSPVPTDELPEGRDLEAGPEEQAVAADEAGRAWALLSRLPDTQRELITLRVAVGLSAQETADALGMTPGAVRVAQHRALGRLRAMMAQDGNGEDDA